MSAYIQRLAKLHAVYKIRHPEHLHYRDEILAIHQASLAVPIHGFYTVTGDAGSGKTTLALEVRDTIMQTAKPGEIPCVYFAIPEEANRKTVVGAMLEQMDDPDPWGPKEAVLLSRLADAVVEKGVELIIVDELQHLVSDNRKVNKKVADLLKHATDLVQKPFVLVGSRDLDLIIEPNRMSQRRVLGDAPLDPFKQTELPEKEAEAKLRNFRAFLRLYDAHLPFSHWCALDCDVMAAALHEASDGLIGFFVQLLRKAGDYALREDALRIEPAHWAQAWRVLRMKFLPSSRRNPFEGLTLPGLKPKAPAALKRYGLP